MSVSATDQAQALEAAWQALNPRQRELVSDGPPRIQDNARTMGVLGRQVPALLEADGTRTPWGVEVATYIRGRGRGRGSAPVAVIPRATCATCGREGVAVKQDGQHYAHTDSGGSACAAGPDVNMPGPKSIGPVAGVWLECPRGLRSELARAAKRARVLPRDIVCEALVRAYVDRGWMCEPDARALWRRSPVKVRPLKRGVALANRTAVEWALPDDAVRDLGQHTGSSRAALIIDVLLSMFSLDTAGVPKTPE